MNTGFSNDTITIHLVNSYGAQYHGNKSVPAGTTIFELFNEETGDADPAFFLIRHNSVEKPNIQTVLRDGDRVSITPESVKAAN